jgi:hypothetical protein
MTAGAKQAAEKVGAGQESNIAGLKSPCNAGAKAHDHFRRLVKVLSRQPGTKEVRYAHLFSGEPAEVVNPQAEPMVSSRSERPSAAARIWPGSAPKAMRMPSSRMRLLTTYDAIPKIPVTASIAPSSPITPSATLDSVSKLQENASHR